MRHCFNAIWICSQHRPLPQELPSDPALLLVRAAGAVALQVRRSKCAMTGWTTALTEEGLCPLPINNKKQFRVHFDRHRDSQGLGGRWDRLKDIKEGSGFPCASALFLVDWNVLQEQHKLCNGFTTRQCASWPDVFLMRSGVLVLFPAAQTSASSEMH